MHRVVVVDEAVEDAEEDKPHKSRAQTQHAGKPAMRQRTPGCRWHREAAVDEDSDAVEAIDEGEDDAEDGVVKPPWTMRAPGLLGLDRVVDESTRCC